MKFLLLCLTLVYASMITHACAAEKKVEDEYVVIRAGDRYGLGVAIDNPGEDDDVKAGAVILDVLEDSEAEKIGLKEKDIFVEFEGKKIESAEQLHDLIKDFKEEKEVSFVIIRDGKRMDFKATIKEYEPRRVTVEVNADDFDFSGLDEFDMDIRVPDAEGPMLWHAGRKGGFLGIEADNLSGQMLDYFEVTHGVLVEKVLEDTPAEKAGLKAGDIITGINDREVNDYSDLVRTLNYYNPGEKVDVRYVRKGKSGKKQVELAEHKGPSFRFDMHHDGGNGKAYMFFNGDSLKNELKVIRKKMKNVKEKVKNIDIDLDFFII